MIGAATRRGAFGRHLMSKQLVAGLTSVLIACAVSVQADEPRAVLERAIKAMGGDVDPAKRPATRVTFTFKSTDGAAGSGEFLYQPRKTRLCNLVAQERGEKHTLRIVLEDSKVLIEADGRRENLGGDELAMMRGLELMFDPVGAL